VFCELSFDASAFAGESTSPRTALIGTLPASYAHFLPVYDYQRSSCRRWRSKWQTACSRIISGSYRGPQRTANDSA